MLDHYSGKSISHVATLLGLIGLLFLASRENGLHPTIRIFMLGLVTVAATYVVARIAWYGGLSHCILVCTPAPPGQSPSQSLLHRIEMASVKRFEGRGRYLQALGFGYGLRGYEDLKTPWRPLLFSPIPLFFYFAEFLFLFNLMSSYRFESLLQLCKLFLAPNQIRLTLLLAVSIIGVWFYARKFKEYYKLSGARLPASAAGEQNNNYSQKQPH